MNSTILYAAQIYGRPSFSQTCGARVVDDGSFQSSIWEQSLNGPCQAFYKKLWSQPFPVSQDLKRPALAYNLLLDLVRAFSYSSIHTLSVPGINPTGSLVRSLALDYLTSSPKVQKRPMFQP